MAVVRLPQVEGQLMAPVGNRNLTGDYGVPGTLRQQQYRIVRFDLVAGKTLGPNTKPICFQHTGSGPFEQVKDWPNGT